MSYLPIPRCIAISCTNSPSDMSYFVVLTMARIDYEHLSQEEAFLYQFPTLSLEGGTLQYGYDNNYVFTDPSLPTSGGAFDALLPCCPVNGPIANTFSIDYSNGGNNTYPAGSVATCPITQATGTINPPKGKPKRDVSSDSGDPQPFFLTSINDPTNISLGVVINIPPNINPRLSRATQTAPGLLNLAAMNQANNAYDIAIFNIQPASLYDHVQVAYQDGSSTNIVPTAGAQTFQI
jgi:hypothetical protein